MDHQAVNGACPRGVEGCPCSEEDAGDLVFVLRWLGPKPKNGAKRARMYLAEGPDGNWQPRPSLARRWPDLETAGKVLEQVEGGIASIVGMMGGGSVRVVKRISFVATGPEWVIERIGDLRSPDEQAKLEEALEG